MKPFIIAIFFACYSAICFALPTTQEPVFTDFWYTEAEVIPGNTCANQHWRYTNKNHSIEAIAQTLQQQLPANTECTWEPPQLTQAIADIPPDFPGTPTPLHIHNAYQWSATCVNTQGQVIDVNTHIIHPSFSCPKNTTFAKLADDSKGGCYPSVDIACAGDIAGRDLESSILLQKAGHVGLSLGGARCSSDQTDCYKPMYDDSPLTSAIAEVIGPIKTTFDSVIHIDSLTSFINTMPGNFWGVKYDVPSHTTTLADMALMNEGIGEQMVLPSEYSLFPFYADSKGYRLAGYYTVYVYDKKTHAFIAQTTFLPGVFRCDTFVVYAYSLAGIKIPYTFMMPFTIYDAFVHTRVLDENTNTLKTPLKNHTTSFMMNIPLQEKILLVFSQTPFDITSADAICYQYITDEHISRDEKIVFLWGLAESVIDNEDKFTYITSVLSSLKPVELADTLITHYRNSHDDVIKIAILHLLENAVFYLDKETADTLSVKQKNNTETIIKFITRLAREKTNGDIQSHALQASQIILPDAESQRIFADTLKENPRVVTSAQITQHKMSHSLQHATLTNEDNTGKNAKQFCVNIEKYPTEQLNETYKHVLSAYLLKNKFVLTNDNATIKNCAWLSTLATLNSNDMPSKIAFEKNYLIGLTDKKEFVTALNTTSINDLKHMDDNTLRLFITTLNKNQINNTTAAHQDKAALINTLLREIK